MIKLKNEYNSYSKLGESYLENEKKISSLCLDTKIKSSYINVSKVSNKLSKKTYNFKLLRDKFVISDKINKNIFLKIENFDLKFKNSINKNVPIIDGKHCINSLLEFKNIYGTNFSKGDSTYNNLFKEEIPKPTETYYWDDTNNAREGIRIINKEKYTISGISIYGSSSYPLYECYLEQMNDSGVGYYIKRLNYQYGVSNEGNSSYKPMYYTFDESYNSIYTDFVRYLVKNSRLTRVLVFGMLYKRKILLEKNGNYYSINNDNYNNISKQYDSLGSILDEAIFQKNSFEISDLLKEKNIDDETFIPLDKFNDFKIVILTEKQEELDYINEILLTIQGSDVTYPIFDKEQPKMPTDTNKLLETMSYIIKSDAIRCSVLSNKRRKFVLQPNVQTKIIMKIIGKKDDEDDGELKGDIKGFTFICQKGHYVELNLNFVEENTKIDFVSNLPEGLIFENGKIKGTPLKSGITTLEMHTTKNQVLQCNIEVPPLIRLL